MRSSQNLQLSAPLGIALSVNSHLAIRHTIDGWSMWKYKGLVILVQGGTNLKGHSSSTAHIDQLHVPCMSCTITQHPTAKFCFPCPFQGHWSQGHSLINILHSPLRLRVCFLGTWSAANWAIHLGWDWSLSRKWLSTARICFKYPSFLCQRRVL